MLRRICIILAVTLCGATNAAPRYARDLPAQPMPLTIVTNPQDGFSVAGHFAGTYQVHPGYIEVALTAASVQLLGTPSHQRGRVITDVRIGLAEPTEGGKWKPSSLVTLATPEQVMKVGDAQPLSPAPVRIPVAATLDLSKRWLVVEIASTYLDPADANKTKSGTCYAHSKFNLFAAAAR
ncbi:MAG: hypothetical protein NTV51_06770 [Verrucomicrobia bacterium]|nr:hypothetical protein [Verrucomicrobiota bacterium]